MVKFYLKNEELEVLVYPVFNETQDETLDDITIKLKANENPLPIAPCQPVRVEINEESFYFITATDQVAIYSTHPLLYSHTLTLTQNIKDLDKHLLRNSVFSQPARPIKMGYFALPNANRSTVFKYSGIPRAGDLSSVQSWCDNVFLSKKEKVKNVKIKISANGLYFGTERILEKIDDLSVLNKESVIVFGEGVFATDITIGSNTIVNEWVSYPEIANKLNLYVETFGEADFAFTPKDSYVIAGEGCPYNFVVLRIEMEVETYFWTAYDILDTIIKQYKLENDDFSKDNLFNLPQSGELYDLLKNTITPTMTFTQCTIFEAVADVFKLFDAIFTLDGDNVLGIEYLNDNNKNTVAVSTPITGTNVGIGEDRFNNGLITYFQNAQIKESFPTTDLTKVAGLRSLNLGVAQNYSFVFKVPHNISYITKLFTLMVSDFKLPRMVNMPSNSTIWEITWSDIATTQLLLDCSSSVFEKELMGTMPQILPEEMVDFNQNSLYNSVFYTKGTDYIEIGTQAYYNFFGQDTPVAQYLVRKAWCRYFGFGYNYNHSISDHFPSAPSGANWQDYKFSVEYITSVDGRTKIETLANKYDGEMLVNQNQGLIDIEKMGLNVLGLSLKLGEPSLSMSHEITSWNERIKKGQIYIDENGNRWLANVCSYTILNDSKFKGNIEFTKNFNSLAQSIVVDRTKRLSNVSRELAVKSEDNIIEYLYFTTENYQRASDESIFRHNLMPMLRNTFVAPTNIDDIPFIDYAKIDCKDLDGNELTSSIYIPLVKYGSGNAICLETSFSDPISAGDQTEFGERVYTKVVPYTDNDGWADVITIKYCQTADENFTDKFPVVEMEQNLVGGISNLKYYKKPNEIFALNYEMIVLPKPERINIDFIGQNFITNNGILKNFKTEGNMYLYYDDTGYQYSVLDTVGYGNREQVRLLEFSEADLENVITMDIYSFYSGLDRTITSWALCDEAGNIYLASNNPTNIYRGSKISCKFFVLHKRNVL